MSRRGLHYAWVVVAATFFTMLVTAGAVGAPGVLLLPLQRELGWSTAAISSALAMRLLLFGLMGPFAAAFINRYGVRKVVLSALCMIGLGLVLSLGMTHVWELIVLWGIVVGLGTGLTALVLAATVSTRWFNARRGLIVGLLTASSATGQLLFLPLLASMATRSGWRSAVALVCVLLGTAAALVWLFMCDRPADLGLGPYGAVDPVDDTAPPRTPIAVAALHALRDATVPPTVNITVKVFGRDKANLVFGWVFAGHQLGAATAALGAGLSRTELATYLPAFMAAGLLCIVAAGLTLRLTPTRLEPLRGPPLRTGA
jgi:MFS family permease